MKTRRWLEPSTIQGRQEYRDLRKELREARSKKHRQELTAKLDSLYGRTNSESGTPKPLPPAKPCNKDLRDLADRVKRRSPEMLLSASDIQAVSEMDLARASTEWYKTIQTQWPEVGFERIMQRSWLLRWRMDTLKGTVTESFADYWKPRFAAFERDMEFNARFATASPEQRDNMIDERLGWMRTTPAPTIPRIASPSGPPSKVPAPVEEPKPANPKPLEVRTLPSEPRAEEPSPAPSPHKHLAEVFASGDNWLRRLAPYADLQMMAIDGIQFELKAGRPVPNEFLGRLYDSIREHAIATSMEPEKSRVRSRFPSRARNF